MTLSCFTVLVKKMEESLTFYINIMGLKLCDRIHPESGVELAFLMAGSTQLELVCNQESPSAAIGNAVSLSFEVSSLDETMALLKDRGIPIVSGPFRHPNMAFLFIQDPNGLKIEFKQVL